MPPCSGGVTSDAYLSNITYVSGNKLEVHRGGIPYAKPAPKARAVISLTKFAVADRNGIIRDYYSATNDDAVEHVAGVVRELLKED